MNPENFANDVLQPVLDENIPLLLKLLEKDMPLSVSVCNWIRVQMNWKTKIPDMQVEILCPRGEWRTGIVVLLGRNLELNGSTFGEIYCGETQAEQLREALVASNRVPWAKISFLRGVLPSYVEAIKEVITQKIGHPPIQYHLALHYLSADEAIKLELPKIPSEARLSRLETQHVDKVCSLWPHYAVTFLPVVHAMVDHNLTTGVFVGDQLTSMVLETEYGGVGLLQTVPEFERRGYGSLAFASFTRDLGRAGVHPHLFVVDGNELSNKLIKRLGYKFVTKTSTISVSAVK